METVLARPDLSDRLLDEAARLVTAGRPAEAWPLLRHAAEELHLPQAWPPLAEVLLLLDLSEAAIAACDAGLVGGGGRAALLVSRARAHGRLGQTGQALGDAADAVAAAPRDAAARTVLGQALLASGRHDEALAVLGEVWRDSPDDAGGALRLADALLAARAHEAVEELTGWLLARDLAPLQRQQATALAAQNALARGTPEDALRRAEAGLAAHGATGEARWVAALHSIAAHGLIALQRLAQAAPHLAAAHRLAPGDQYLAHLAATASTNDGSAAPARASDDYVRRLFDGYAVGFEASLFGLGYRAPGLILGLLEELRPSGMLGEVLDLGCGTGLMGVVLHDRLGAGLRGIDLSGAMLEEARAKGVYTSLAQADIDGWLARDEERYELVIAADVFCYFGALDGTLAAIAPRLAPGGLLLFSVEAGAPGDWELLPSGRYRHSETGVRAALRHAGLEVAVLRPEALRQERGRPLGGYLVAARR